MGKIPVLKPREVISILHHLGFALIRHAVHTNNSAMQMEEAPQFPIIKDAISRQPCYGKLQKTLV
jgi:hypothetical protein